MTLILVLIPFASAGLGDLIDRLTGKATSSPVDINITVGAGDAPIIYAVYNDSITDVSSGLNEGSTPTYVIINFSVSDTNGYANLDESSAQVNFSKSGETNRTASCTSYEQSGDYANYTCNVTMWWWDGAGTWQIFTSINDLNDNAAHNSSRTFAVGTTAGFVSFPSALTWSEINPGATNQLSNNDPIILNNTGNLVRNIEINSTNLMGEDDNTKGLYAGNFSANTADACEGTSMTDHSYAEVSGASLAIGNYTLNDGTAQESIYFCLEEAGSELTAQSYSTAEEGAWTMRITS